MTREQLEKVVFNAYKEGYEEGQKDISSAGPVRAWRESETLKTLRDKADAAAEEKPKR